MAFNDTLFQLGMDLTRSSPAQKEESIETAPVAQREERKDHFTERNGERFAGTHLIIDLFGAKRLDDISFIERTLKRCVEVAGATLVGVHLHHCSSNGGVAGVAVLAESHISIHSWPEADYAALDIFMCGETKPALAISVLKEAFDARDVVVKEHLRGQELDELRWRAASNRKAPVRLTKPARKADKERRVVAA